MISLVKQHLAVVLAVSLLLCACTGGGQDLPLNYDLPAEDLEVFDTGKADGNIFNPERIIEDHVFEDAHFLSLADVRAFLSWTPYNRASFLAYYRENDVDAAEIIFEAAQDFQINPLVLLVKLQVESSLIGRLETPSTYILDRCMGCGCQDDNPSCFGAPKGFRNQLICASALFRDYLNDLEEYGETWTGWAVGKNKLAADDQWISPENNATAALYTYTPWVLQGQGGNWLFWNVYRKYAHHILKTRPNHRWIGGLCDSDAICGFEEGRCNLDFALETSSSAAPIAGFCTRPCDRYCPDSNSAFNAMTFCVDLGSYGDGEEPSGWCVSKCDDTIYPINDGCTPGFECRTQERFNEPEIQAKVCMPVLPEGIPTEERENPADGEDEPSDDPDRHN